RSHWNYCPSNYCPRGTQRQYRGCVPDFDVGLFHHDFARGTSRFGNFYSKDPRAHETRRGRNTAGHPYPVGRPVYRDERNLKGAAFAMAFETHGILDTIEMIEKYRLDIRTVTMGISLLGCTRTTMEETCQAIYDRVTTQAEHLVEVCEGIEAELGIPIVNKRISVTPISLVVAGVDGDPVDAAKALDKAAKKVGVNFVGGYSALVEKGATTAEKKLINSIPEALATTDVVCSSVNI